MALQYTNRVGKTYYLSRGKTKYGKTQYYFSLKPKNNSVDTIPEGYEIYEHPEKSQVFMRKIRPRLISELEEKFVKNQVNALHRTRRYLVDCKDKYITIYESNAEPENLNNILGNLLDMMPTQEGVDTKGAMDCLMSAADQNYTAMLRFFLEDKEKRIFSVERFCFRGRSDKWIYLAQSENFKSLVKKYVNMLGTDDYFESPY
ncbi:hypothetical protein [methanotrophic endosymbiont of Bathymodiolus puteoserpentis (Logatchev)]|jgi:hypothetical protein|uniref:hypothetical protein n=1 Tax=methanotrophic endosymbiont of Bathymodiolus puteoserpentis (Logatchev) TaxID=343235 RepID=UPI0013CAD36A|nr:hypothetical protein [methanotrophic endosymbiont of Bathymodiolus puteoserpentis (Logatchev)]SHE22463.1 hypothetical protein BPUTEOMOX_2967 [methanotrophic endosymbiont of Bathymodiolus puteoserpentis (Logatchev)]